MGTRSTTRVIDSDGNGGEVVLANMYGQWDGYPSGHGRDLALWLKSLTVVAGISDYKAKNTANGIMCLAAQVIGKFKQGIGCYYLMPPTQEPEYHSYEIRVDADNKIRLRMTYDGKQVFNGQPKNFRAARIKKRIEKLYD